MHPLNIPLDLTHPGFALVFRFRSIHVGPSCSYASHDRGRTWRGPYAFAVEGIDEISTRTGDGVTGPRECLMFSSAAKADGREGRPFCARTTDGGRGWRLVSLIGPEPPGFAIMPSTVRLPGGVPLTAIRHGDPGRRHDIDVWRSDDEARHWTCLGPRRPTSAATRPTWYACPTYGYRRPPCGIRSRISGDEGRS